MTNPAGNWRRLLILTSIVWLAWFTCASAFAQQKVTYPRPESNNDTRGSYPIALLQLCEQKSNHAFVIQPSSIHAQQSRYLRQLALNQGIDVVWSLTSKEREEQLLPIRIPIDRGLLGWRLLLIHKNNQALFANVHDPESLAPLRAGLGHDWPDVDIFRANGLRVTTASSYEGLFNMLAFNHSQYFPRAISEVWPELASHSDLPITVEDSLAIHYPTAFYFFVNKQNLQLSYILESCLRSSINDGSMKIIFDQYFHDAIDRAKLGQRHIIDLKNPLLPAATPLQTSAYWFSPQEH